MEKPLVICWASILHFNIMEIVLWTTALSQLILLKVYFFFHVHNHIPFLSDHAKLLVKLAAQFSHYMSPIENGVSYNMLIIYRWIKESSLIFPNAFNTHDVKEKISRLMESSFIVQNQKFSETEALDTFNDIIYTACSRSLKKIYRQKKS